MNAPDSSIKTVVKQEGMQWSFTKKIYRSNVCWLLSLAYMSSHNGVKGMLVTYSPSQWENQSVWIPCVPTIDSFLCLESLPTVGIFLILCIPNMDCHCFLKVHESPCGGASARPTSPCHHTPQMLLSPGGSSDSSPLELDKLWNVPSLSSIIIHELLWHWWGLYLFYWHISNICPLWNVCFHC